MNMAKNILINLIVLTQIIDKNKIKKKIQVKIILISLQFNYNPSSMNVMNKFKQNHSQKYYNKK